MADPAVTDPLTPDQLMDAVLEIVHVRTGYPREMLDPGLDLEADLSVDSIKRVEIIGALADRIGLPQGADGPAESAVEELARLKTISGIVDWIVARGTTTDPAVDARTDLVPGLVPGAGLGAGWAAGGDRPPNVVQDPATGPAPSPVAERSPARPARLLVEVTPVGPPATRDPADVLPGRRFAVVDDGLGVAVALAAALEAQGAEVRTVHQDRLADAAGSDADGVVDLSALRPAPAPVLPEAFAALRETLIAGTRRLLLVTGCGGAFGRTAQSPDAPDAPGSPGSADPDPIPGAGLYGFARTAAIEYPGTQIRAVDVDPKDRPERIAAHLIAELCAPEEPVAVGYTNGTRNTLRTVPAPSPTPHRRHSSRSAAKLSYCSPAEPAASPLVRPSPSQLPPAATSNSSAALRPRRRRGPGRRPRPRPGRAARGSRQPGPANPRRDRGGSVPHPGRTRDPRDPRRPQRRCRLRALPGGRRHRLRWRTSRHG